MTSIDPVPPPAARPKRGARFWLKALAVILITLLVFGGIVLLVLYRMSTSTPEFWDRNQEFIRRTDPAELKRIADNLQKKALADISSPGNGNGGNPPGSTPGTGQTTRMVIALSDINAWLNANLPGYLAHKGIKLPPRIAQFTLATQNNDRILLAFESDQPMLKQVITATFRVEIQSDGKAFVQLESIRAGSLPIPASTVLMAIPQSENSRVQASADSMRNLISGQTVDPVVHIDRSRQARVTAIELGPDQIIVTFKTEKRE